MQDFGVPADIRDAFASPAGALTAAGERLEQGDNEVPLLVETESDTESQRRITGMAAIWDAHGQQVVPEPYLPEVAAPQPVVEVPRPQRRAQRRFMVDIDVHDRPTAALALN